MSQTNQQQPKVYIYQDGKLLKTFTGSDCETHAFGYMHRVQPHSVLLNPDIYTSVSPK